MTEFNIHEVKRVKYLYDEGQVNFFIGLGWKLLSAGFTTIDGNLKTCCILGSVLDEDPKTPEEEILEHLPPNV